MAVSNDDALLRNDGVYRWRVLSHGIPAESFATGANRIPKFSDVLLRFTRKAKSRNDYHMSMEVSFTNQMYGGDVLKRKSVAGIAPSWRTHSSCGIIGV